jgi:hypothetical protein
LPLRIAKGVDEILHDPLGLGGAFEIGSPSMRSPFSSSGRVSVKA